MILPASTISPPLRELPPAFLCAMAAAPYFFFLAPPALEPPALASSLVDFLARDFGSAVRPVAFFFAGFASSSSSLSAALGFTCLAGLGVASLRGEGLAPSVRISSMRTRE